MSLSSTDKGLLTPGNCAMIFIDRQPQMFFGVVNIEVEIHTPTIARQCQKFQERWSSFSATNAQSLEFQFNFTDSRRNAA